VAKLQLDQHVRVLGFPGVSQSTSLTVTDGVISTFVPDPLGHVHDNRFELETTARVAHGNSGGAAIDDHGDLIGVPSLTIPGQGGDVSWRLRSVAEAVPLIDAARAGRAYTSHLLVARTGREGLDGVGVGATGDAACGGSQSAASGLADLAFGFDVTNVPANLDFAVLIVQPDGSLVQDVHGSIPESTFPAPGGSSCDTITVPAGLVNAPVWPDGTYQVQLLVGPDLDPVGPGARLSVGSGSGSGGGSGTAGSGT
jgi:putative serine protease PepD